MIRMKRLTPTEKFLWKSLSAFSSLILFTGCSQTITNLTPDQAMQNPSNTYRLTMHTTAKESSALPNTYKANVVIDGETHQMQKGPLGNEFYIYDHYLPSDRAEAAYYFNVKYNYQSRGENKTQEFKSPLYHLKVAMRHVFSLESERGPVGAKISVVGSGFTTEDKVIVGDFAAETEFVSRNVVLFIIPTLITGKTYPVYVMNGAEKQFVGNLLVDKGRLHVDVDSLQMRKGDHQPITFKTDTPVSGAGLYLNVTTDVPNSVIMPEVIIPAKQDSVTVTVEAGEPGEGQIFVEAPGYEELAIPVQVSDSGNMGGGFIQQTPSDFNASFNTPPPAEGSLPKEENPEFPLK